MCACVCVCVSLTWFQLQGVLQVLIGSDGFALQLQLQREVSDRPHEGGEDPHQLRGLVMLTRLHLDVLRQFRHVPVGGAVQENVTGFTCNAGVQDPVWVYVWVCVCVCIYMLKIMGGK